MCERRDAASGTAAAAWEMVNTFGSQITHIGFSFEHTDFQRQILYRAITCSFAAVYWNHPQKMSLPKHRINHLSFDMFFRW